MDPEVAAGSRWWWTGPPLGGLIQTGELVTVRDVGADDPSFGGDLTVEVPPDPEGSPGHPGTVGRAVAVSSAEFAAHAVEEELLESTEAARAYGEQRAAEAAAAQEAADQAAEDAALAAGEG